MALPFSILSPKKIADNLCSEFKEHTRLLNNYMNGKISKKEFEEFAETHDIGELIRKAKELNSL